MKKTVIIGLVVLVIGVAAYLYQDLQGAKGFTAVKDFETDDNRLYLQMRADLQGYLASIGETYGGWLDDEAADNYASAAYAIGGRPSKAAAYAAAAGKHYAAKNRWYSQLVKNLTTQYS